MSTPFKLKSGNKPNKKIFFNIENHPMMQKLIKKGKNLLSIRSKEDAAKVIGYSKKDIKGK